MIIGIDPGMSGAIAVRCQGWTRLYDIPTVKTTKISGNNTRTQNDIDFQKLIQIVKSIRDKRKGETAIVVCEFSAALSFKGNSVRETFTDSGKSVWKKGYNFGIIRAMFEIFEMPYTYTPRPGDWKRVLKLTDSTLTDAEKKEKARLKAIELFPEMEKGLKRKKDSDRAEALLLTVWAELKGTKK